MRRVLLRTALVLALGACGRTGEECDEPRFADADADGHGDPTAVRVGCPSTSVMSADDCDDASAVVHPGAPERCDGIDNDCDGEVDVDVVDGAHWYVDQDGDGFGDDRYVTEACASPPNTVGVGGDCDDHDAAVHPGAEETCGTADEDCDGLVDWLDPGLVDGTVWFSDEDGDGYGDPTTGALSCEPPVGRVLDASDCDDGDPSVHPGVVELCDGLDNDCDGDLDDADPPVVDGTVEVHRDSDGDGLGDANAVAFACVAAFVGYVLDASDCDDADAGVGGPVAYYDDIDHDGYGVGRPSEPTCTPDGSLYDTDCAPGESDMHPGATEVCNDRDDNCDGLTDTADPLLVATTWYRDDDVDGYGDFTDSYTSCEETSGYVPVGNDCDDDDGSVHPDAMEFCDGVDEDCDGTVDDAVETRDWYADADGDGFGDTDDVKADCVQPSGYLLVAGDCDDGSATTHPGASEVCADGIDNDCDEVVDNCSVDLAAAVLVLDSRTDGARVGGAIAVGDIDDDKVADLLLGCSGAEAGLGAVYVVYGPATGALAVGNGTTVSTSATGTLFGSGVATADANGDEIADLLIGAPENAYLFLGPVTADLDATDADLVLLGRRNSCVGVELDVVHDVDGDSLADVVIGAPCDGPDDWGVAYVVSGLSSGEVTLESDATYAIHSATALDKVGFADADLGDATGDGVHDLALGAYHASSGGRVYAFEGGVAAGTYDASTAAFATLSGPSYAEFGASVAGVDLDGDGLGDLLVGAPQADNGVGDDSGLVYGFLGPLSGFVDYTNAFVRWESSDEDAELGTSVAADGSVDGDGIPDVLLAAPFGGTGPQAPGAAFLQLGLATGVVEVEDLVSFPGVAKEFVGTSVAFVPDWDGDAFSEVVIGAPGALNGSGDESGAVYLFGSGQLVY